LGGCPCIKLGGVYASKGGVHVSRPLIKCGPTCRPGSDRNLRYSGLWNVVHTGGPTFNRPISIGEFRHISRTGVGGNSSSRGFSK